MGFGLGKTALSIAATGLAALGLFLNPMPAGATDKTCDEACLKGFMDVYLDALSHRDPSKLPVAKTVRYTENGAEVQLGQALWVTFESLGKYRHDFYDPSTGGVAAYVSLTENGFPDLLSVRLKIADHRITEIETIVWRNSRNAENMPPRDPSWMEIFNRVEPPATRLTRQQLIDGAVGYMRAIAFQDGSLAPFGESCIRLEGGSVMAMGPKDRSPVLTRPLPPGRQADEQWFAAIAKTLGLGCAKQVDTKVYGFITGYEDAHFPIVDVPRQVVYGTFDFMRRGNVKTVTIGGKTYQLMPSTLYPNEMLNTDSWKFVDGKITRIEAVFAGPQAFMRGTGWPGGTKAVSRPNSQ